MRGFYKVRLETYHKRKDYLEGILNAEASKLSNQARFIVEKCDGTIVIENKKKKDMIAELIKRGYESDPVVAWKLLQNREEVLVSIIKFFVLIMYIEIYVENIIYKNSTIMPR